MDRRYQSLKLRDAISRRNDYVEACKELQGILKAVYKSAPKPLQSILYEDVVHAFRSLPEMENKQQLEAARLLLQTVEDVFPKQRRASAALQHKIAMITWHRQFKYPEPLPECSQLSGDTLLHVFEYLDPQSLAIASAVCRTWNVAATDNALWCNQFKSLFAAKGSLEPQEVPVGFWYETFKAFIDIKEHREKLFFSNRAFCSVCQKVLWLVEPHWKPVKGMCVANKKIHFPHSMSLSQVVRYVERSVTPKASDYSSSSDSDDDSTQNSFRLWQVRKVTLDADRIHIKSQPPGSARCRYAQEDA